MNRGEERESERERGAQLSSPPLVGLKPRELHSSSSTRRSSGKGGSSSSSKNRAKSQEASTHTPLSLSPSLATVVLGVVEEEEVVVEVVEIGGGC